MVFLPLEIWTINPIAANFAKFSYGKLAQVEIQIAHVLAQKRKAREGGDSAVARFTGFMQFCFTKPWGLRSGLYNLAHSRGLLSRWYSSFPGGSS
jgi:hypothetical protein